MFWNKIKTTLLLGVLSGLFFLVGYLIGGQSGMTIAFVLALIMNGMMYYYSDRLVLKLYKAQPLDRFQYEHVYDIVEELTDVMKLPMPKLWYIPTEMSNAFATGRNPQHASVALTKGILELLDTRELRGVLAHELSHVQNRDILIGTIAATVAMAIAYLADMFKWSAIFGGYRRDRDSGSPLGAILIAFLVPIAAMLIQMAISRSREYLADDTGSNACEDPDALADALEKLGHASKTKPIQPASQAQAATATLFIVYPFHAKNLMQLFSTHPPMEKRIARLRSKHRNNNK